MDRFSSTGLISLIHNVVSGIDADLLGGLRRPDPMQHAVSSEAAKRDLVARVLDRLGPGILLSVGQYLDLADETPAITVLKRSPDPAVLAEKWMRLERYYHSSNRIRIDREGAHKWACTRTNTEAPATLGENCLISGLLLGLLQAIGVEGAQLWIGAREFDPKQLQHVSLPPEESLETFVITWRADRAGQVSDTMAGPTDVPVNARLTDLLASDIGQSWKLSDAARNLAFSERSLQRHLSGEGYSFSSILRRARMRAATDLLTRSRAPLAEIGYCCGYADQAHFQRDFLRTTNMTPRVFRGISGDVI
ncbi:AraC family transcriptional regulator [Thalassovita sp.]|uniref:helix-turn-helix transcriptional regulator n=1 Tax=Thalassovita sp. TaxID=1979401 RepID=UPI002B2772A5|nr:AraC family transcriptional regulator [Thalassovita sp.]